MAVDITEKTVKAYQTARLKEGSAPKTINEEVGFLLRLLGEAGDIIRVRLRRQKSLKLAVRQQVGKAYSPEEKDALLKAANTARSPAIYPALMLALNAGMRDAEIRGGRTDYPIKLCASRRDDRLCGVVQREIWNDSAEVVCFRVWETTAKRPDEIDCDIEDFLEQRSEESGSYGPVARQSAHADHRPC
jgi:hypothetical protein